MERRAYICEWLERLRIFGDGFLENVGLEKLTRHNEMLCEVWLHIWIDYTFFFGPISVGYHSELCVAMAFAAIIAFYQLSYIISF